MAVCGDDGLGEEPGMMLTRDSKRSRKRHGTTRQASVDGDKIMVVVSLQSIMADHLIQRFAWFATYAPPCPPHPLWCEMEWLC